MISIKRTDADDVDFKELVKALDTDLNNFYRDENSFYENLNQIDKLKYVVVAYEDEIPVGCGAFKEYDHDTMEVKRMFVPTSNRGKGIASKILHELENWSKELNFKKCILETLKQKPDANRLYEKNNYKIIPNFGEYVSAKNSVCFEKDLTH